MAGWCRLRDAVANPLPTEDAPGDAASGDPFLAVRPVSWARLAESLDRIGLPWREHGGRLVTISENHSTAFSLERDRLDDESPDAWDESADGADPSAELESNVLVITACAHASVPVDWERRALTATNEWNRTRRFLRSYLGPCRDDGRQSLFADLYLPLGPGLHDPLLDDLLDSTMIASQSWADWLHNDALLL